MDAKKTSFEINYLQRLDKDANIVGEWPEFAKDKATVIELYRLILLIRAFDAKAVALQRTGQMGTYPSSLGQEAVAVGMGHAMKKTDVHCPYYRDQGALIQRDITLTEVLTYWGGDERGACYKNNKQDFPPAIPIATQYLHAAGVAYAIKLRDEKRAVVTSGGDGSTSKGDFYEAINFAGTQQLPIVFVVNNNQWAISVPLKKQTHAQTLAQKAISAGIDCLQVDGNDVIAVREAVENALEKAKTGKGPTLIEALTYRICDHTTADDASRYCDQDDAKKAWALEPISRMKKYLSATYKWSEEEDKKLIDQCKNQVEESVKEYLSIEPAKATDMFDYLYENLPESIKEQRKCLK